MSKSARSQRSVARTVVFVLLCHDARDVGQLVMHVYADAPSLADPTSMNTMFIRACPSRASERTALDMRRQRPSEAQRARRTSISIAGRKQRAGMRD